MSTRRLAAQSRFELKLLARNGENLLVTLVVPLGMLVFFSLVPVLPTGGQAPVAALTPGVMTVGIMGSAMVSLGISTGFERDQGVLTRLGVTPLRRGELVAAKAIAVLAVQGVQVLLVVACALALGWRPTPSASGLLIGGLGLVLASVAFAGIGLGIAGRLPALRALALINVVFLVLLMLAGLLVPLAALPPALQTLARGLPPAQTTALLDAVLTGEAGREVTAPILVLGAWAVVAAALAARAFRWEQ